MKLLNNFFSKTSWWGYLLIMLLLIFVSYAIAHNKTVVIPLFDNEESTRQTQHFVVGGEAFVPGTNVNYVNTYGCGGAFVDSPGSHALVAQVNLPHGAELTKFEVFFNDTSDEDMTTRLHRHNLTNCGYSTLAKVDSSGTDGYYSKIDDVISETIIDNTLYSYHVYAYSTNWDGYNLRIKGAVITYTTP